MQGPPLNGTPRRPGRGRAAKIVRNALIVIVIVGGAFVAPTIAGWRALYRERVQALNATVESQLDLARWIVEKEYFHVGADFAVAARSQPITRFAATRTAQDRSSAAAYLQQFIDNYRRYPHVRLHDLDGRLMLTVAQDEAQRRAYDEAHDHREAHEALVERTLRQPPGRVTVSIDHADPDEGDFDADGIRSSIHLALPILGPDERPTAVLIVHYDASALRREVAQVFASTPADDVWFGPRDVLVPLDPAEPAPDDSTQLLSASMDAWAPEVAEAIDGMDEGMVVAPIGHVFVATTDLLTGVELDVPSASPARAAVQLASVGADEAQWRFVAVVRQATIDGLRPWTDPANHRRTGPLILAFLVLTTLAVVSFDALREARQRALDEALSDALTGAPNRRAFHSDLVREVARAARGGRPLSLVVLDLDHFKQINDRYGHGVGDDVLRSFVATATTTLRSEDAVYRIGGEEFAILFVGAGEADAVQGVERLRAALIETPTLGPDGPITYTASFGIAVAPADRLEGEPELIADRLLSHADDAMYDAKHAGRDRYLVRTFDP